MSVTPAPSYAARSKSTPVLVIRAPVRPPLNQDDWEPPSAFGVCSPEGFKSEISISQLRPYTPSPSVSTFAPSSDTSSTVTTPRVPPSERRQVSHVLEKATQALALHAQQSVESISSESVYSDPGVAPESLFDDKPSETVEDIEQDESSEELPNPEIESIAQPEEPEGELEESRVEPEEFVEPIGFAEIPEYDDRSIITDPAIESLQVARPLSPVAVELASSSSYGTSRSQPIIRSSLLGFFSRWADKRSPSSKVAKERPASSAEASESFPAPSPAQRHDSTTSAPLLSSIVNRNQSTDRLGSASLKDPVKPSSSSLKSSIFKKSSFGGLRLNSARSRSPAPPLPPVPGSTPDIHVASTPETRTVLVADTDIPAEAQSVRSSKRRRRIFESQSSTGTARSRAKPSQPTVTTEEPIGGEPVLISPQSTEPTAPILSLPITGPEARNLPTPPRSRSPSIFRQKLGGASLKDWVRKSSPNKRREDRSANSPAFFSWLASHTHRSQNQNKQSELPTPSATPDPVPPTPSQTDPTSPERVLSLVWYPPELIKSPYASNTSLDQIRAPHNPPAAPPEERQRNISPPPHSVRTVASAPLSSAHRPFYKLDPYPGNGNRVTSASSSTVHAPSTSSGRRTPAKLRRRRRPGNKDKPAIRTPPTSFSPALSRNHSISTESIAGTGASTAPSRSLDTLLNSTWPEPPSVSSIKSRRTNQVYYHSETGAENESDQDEYLPSPTSIGGSAPTSPVEPLPLVPIFFPGQGEEADKDWEPGSRVTSYLSTSPTIRSPATPKALRQDTTSTTTVRPTPPVLKAPTIPARPEFERSGSTQHRRLSANLSQAADSRRDSNHVQHSTGPELWTVPRNQRQRPTLSFEFPPTSQFWEFLNAYQAFTQRERDGGKELSVDSGYAEVEEMERASGSRNASTASRSTGRSVSASGAGAVDPVKGWHKTSVSSQGSVERPTAPYVPTSDVIQRNELIVNALKNAPGALQTRFRHFGQLGVLGWSSEFSELVDEIQRCGLERQMFIATRERALATCRELLRLRVEVSMQMISMFLCSQIARLRRFLDAETEYTDYPTPNFPLPELGNY